MQQQRVIYDRQTRLAVSQSIQSSVPDDRTSSKNSMMDENSRFDTFKTYPDKDKPSKHLFAQAGFFYAGNIDEVICCCSGKRFRDWSYSNDPMEVHKRLFPTCRFFTDSFRSNCITAETPRETTAPSQVTTYDNHCL